MTPLSSPVTPRLVSFQAGLEGSLAGRPWQPGAPSCNTVALKLPQSPADGAISLPSKLLRECCCVQAAREHQQQPGRTPCELARAAMLAEAGHPASELSLLLTVFALSATSPIFLAAGLPLMLVLECVDDLVANH